MHQTSWIWSRQHEFQIELALLVMRNNEYNGVWEKCLINNIPVCWCPDLVLKCLLSYVEYQLKYPMWISPWFLDQSWIYIFLGFFFFNFAVCYSKNIFVLFLEEMKKCPNQLCSGTAKSLYYFWLLIPKICHL